MLSKETVETVVIHCCVSKMEIRRKIGNKKGSYTFLKLNFIWL